MLSAITGFLKRIFGTDITHDHMSPQEKTGFSIGHDWPFPSPEPANPEYLVGELLNGVQTEGDHLFYFWNGQKRRHIRTDRGTETILARNMVWWIDGRKIPQTSQSTGLTTNCGEAKCLKLSHLVLKVPNVQYGPDFKHIPKAEHVARRKQPPLPPRTRPGQHTKLERFAKEDRLKCITRKAYFDTEGKAKTYAVELNRPEVRGTGRRQYAYPCTQGCGGFHLTKINPKKFNQRKIGAW